MKRILLSAATLFIFALAGAQENKSKAPEDNADKAIKTPAAFGFQAGFNYATITNLEGSGMVNYHAGLFAEIPLNEKWAFQPEVTYSGQGTELNNASSIHLNYINIDVLAKYYIGKKFFLAAGPQAGFLVSANAPAAMSPGTVDIKDALNPVDFGGKFGLGYAIDQHTLIQFTYFAGLTQIQKELAPSEAASKNTLFQFTVGYKL